MSIDRFSSLKSVGRPRVGSLILVVVVGLTGLPSLAAGAVRPAATPPVERWTRQFGTTEYEDVGGGAVDALGRSYVVGGTQGTLAGAGNKGGLDAFIRAYSRTGRHLWTRQFGTSGSDVAKDAAVDPDGFIVVVGETAGRLPGPRKGGKDAWVRKYRPDGSLVWARQFGTDGDDDGRGVAIDERGNIFVAGETSGAFVGTPKGGTDAFLRKYSPSGKHRWTRQVGTAMEEWVEGTAADSSGNAWLIMMSNGDLGGDNAGGFDAVVRKYDGSGRRQWTRQFGTVADDYPVDGDADAKGNLYVTGSTNGALPGGGADPGEGDVFVRKLSPAGAFLWTRQFGSDANDFPAAIDVDGRGVAYVGGTTNGAFPGQTHEGAGDAFVRSYGPGGAERWTVQFGTEEGEHVAGIAAWRKDDVRVSGYTEGALASPAKGNGDAFLRRYAPRS